MLLVKNVFFIFIRSQVAESGPPLGTVLGNLGIMLPNFVRILMILLKITFLFCIKGKNCYIRR